MSLTLTLVCLVFGAVLSQVQDGRMNVIVCTSKTRSRSQHRYCTTKRELLAIVQFVTVTFRNYLAPEDEFIIRTDHFVVQHHKGSKHGTHKCCKTPKQCVNLYPSLTRSLKFTADQTVKNQVSYAYHCQPCDIAKPQPLQDCPQPYMSKSCIPVWEYPQLFRRAFSQLP